MDKTKKQKALEQMEAAEKIECAPTWVGILPIYISTIQNQSSQQELKRMAVLADNWNELISSLGENDKRLLKLMSELNETAKRNLIGIIEKELYGT